MSEALDRYPALGLLQVAVPMEIPRVRPMAFEDRLRLAHECAQYLAEHGDNLMFRTRDKEHTSKRAFSVLATSLAIGALQPGGVTFAGMHFCVDHEACRRAEEAARNSTA